MDVAQYFRSLSRELVALRDRVRLFIDDHHWQTDGEWKEAVLRNQLRRNFSNSIQVGRGFVISKSEPSRQIDLLIYDTSKPVLFRDGDLVFVTPDAVRGIVEVKTRLSNSTYKECAVKLTQQLDFVRRNRGAAFGAIFAYESTVANEVALEALKAASGGISQYVIKMACLGEDRLVHFHTFEPGRSGIIANRWHLYEMQELAFGYFLHNCVQYASPGAMDDSKGIWFPPEGKEMHKVTSLSLS